MHFFSCELVQFNLIRTLETIKMNRFEMKTLVLW